MKWHDSVELVEPEGSAAAEGQALHPGGRAGIPGIPQPISAMGAPGSLMALPGQSAFCVSALAKQLW